MPPASSHRSATALPGVQKSSTWVFDNWKGVSAQYRPRRRSSSLASLIVWFLFAQITTLAPLWPSLLTTFHDSNSTLSPPTPLMYFAKYCCCVHLYAALYHDVRTGQRGWNTYNQAYRWKIKSSARNVQYYRGPGKKKVKRKKIIFFMTE